MNLAEAELTLAERGWLVVDLPNPSAVFAVRDRLLAWLREWLPGLKTLDEYHMFVDDDQQHIELLYQLARSYWDHDLGRTIVAANLD